ncbi:MAG: methylated-DNA--[protein]-cysteine S-methyltransferase [Phycisphaerae bacterium]|nr:methylated-DNA--[protein]-cysteine S-methyltransferase [Phycisphaerae bacterium]
MEMKQEQPYFYDIFKTHWGWFGLLGNENGLIRTCLPVAHKEAVQGRMLSDIPNAERSKTAFLMLETQIHYYYRGQPVDFSDVNVRLDGFSKFQQKVLAVLRTVKYGETVSYGQLAKLSGNPKAARAIGSVMAANPLPLIIPCHRVIRADGAPGDFSAPGGTETKIRMLNLENSMLSCRT